MPIPNSFFVTLFASIFDCNITATTTFTHAKIYKEGLIKPKKLVFNYNTFAPNFVRKIL